MSAPSSQAMQPQRSWHAPPPAALVDHSRRVWRWLLSLLALVLVAVGVYWAWPRPATKTLLLILRDDRAERNILPPVPSLQADVDALWEWATAARMPVAELPLSRLDTPQSLVAWLTSAESSGTVRFTRQRGTPGAERLAPGDTLIVYLKAHGTAAWQPSSGQGSLTPLLLKSLTEDDLASDWTAKNSLPLGPLLASLVRLQENPKLVILDAVHLTHDPRLGVVTNLLPHAVRKIAQSELADSRNLWLVVPGPGGEPSCTLPATGRSVWMESMLAALTSPKAGASVPLDQWLAAAHKRWQEQLVAGETVEDRPPELVLSGGTASTLRLPAWPAAEAPARSKLDKAAEQAGKAVGQVAADSAKAAVAKAGVASVPAAAPNTGGGTAAVAPGGSGPPTSPGGASPEKTQPPDAAQAASTGKEATSDKTPAAAVGSASPPRPAGGTERPPPPPAPPGSAVANPAENAANDELDLVWQIRDRLVERWPQGLSPTCFAPDAWRWVEGIIVGFEQRRFCNQTTSGDAATLHDLRLDLERLEAFLSGDRSALPVGPCRPIAQAWELLNQGEAGRSFQGRAGSGLEEANRALWTALHAGYKLGDYVRLECASSILVDGGPSWEEPLQTLLRQLPRLRGLLRPEGLTEERLTEARVGELAQAAEATASLLRELDSALAKYVEGVAREPAGCGRWLRAFVLLQSPLVTASGRAALRQPVALPQPVAQGKAGPGPTGTGSAPPLAASAQRQVQLRRGLGHAAGLLRTVLPPSATTAASQPAMPAGVAALAEEAEALARRLEAVPMNPPPQMLAELGQQWHQVARLWPERLGQSLSTSGAPEASAPTAAARLDGFWLTLAMDGRDAASWRRSLDRPPVPVQPLRPMRLVERVTVTTSAESPTWLALPESPGTPWTLTIDLTTEATPPYPVALELAWERSDLELVWDATGQPVRLGANPLTLRSSREEFALRAIPRRVETNPSAATTRVTATVRFGQAAPAQAVANFLLPRPDRLELVVARPSDPSPSRLTWEPQGELGGRVLLFPNRSRRLGLWLRNLSSQEKRLVAQLYRVPPGLAGAGGRLFDPRGSGQLVASLADLHSQLTRGEGPLPAALRGMLLAKSNPDQPLVVPPLGSRLVPLPLTAAGSAGAAGGPAPAPAGASPGPESAGLDVTAGLVLILTSPDPTQRPAVQWIELAVPDPDEWLAAQRPEQHEGALHLRVGLKDAALAAELGLEGQPLHLVWDRRTLPDEVRERTLLERQLTADARPVLFTANLPPTLPWPLYLALHADGYPRALLLRVDRTLDQLAMTNWKQNRPAAVAITGLRATAGRPGPQARTVAWAYWPPQPYLPLPSAPLGEGVVLRPAGTPLAVRVEEDAPQVRLEADLGAEIASRYFAAGCQVRLEAAGQMQALATARQVRALWRGVSEGSFEVASEVGDWQRLLLGTWEVAEDQQIEVVARVVGPEGGPPPLPASDDRAVVILDRTPPAIRQLTAETVPLPLGATTSLKPRVRFRCRADDGLGSGIDKVEFAAGFDALVKNSRLDSDERIGDALSVPASAASDGWFEATLELPGEVPPQPLLVEARALDRVGFASRTERTSLVVRRPGGDRATFGQGEKKGAAPKKSVENP